VDSETAVNLRQIRRRIDEALLECGRPAGDAILVAVTKTFPADVISRAIAAGHQDFGENRVQEAEEKIPRLADAPRLRWHLVGHLQSNKARRAAELFDVIHSVDSVKLAQKLDRACLDLGKRLSVLIQVDLGQEESKSGVSRAMIRETVSALSGFKNLALNGLMTIPPFFEDPEDVRPFFTELRTLRDSLEAERPGCLGDRHLSMGMSHDFHIAIQEGATMVRIGTAIFGERGGG